MNPFIEVASRWPARIGGCCAAGLVLMLSLLLFFAVVPPVLSLPGQKPVSFNLVLLMQEIWTIGRRADCGLGLTGMLALDCRTAAIWQAIAPSPILPGLLMRCALTLLALGVAAWIAFGRILAATSKTDRLEHIRGRRLRQDALARRFLRHQLARIGKPVPDGLWLVPHVQLSSAAESYNVLAIGTQGAGKTGMLRAWLEQLIARGDRIIVHDVKGDMTAGLPADRFIFLAPHDARSTAWDIARDITDRAAALEFATRSIKAAKADSMWADGARALWADAIVSLAKKHGRSWTLRTLYELLTSPPATFKSELEAGGAASAELIAFDESGGVQRTSMSLLITLWVAALTTLKPLVDAWTEIPTARRFSLQQWLSVRSSLPKTIVIQKSAEYPELSSLVGGLLVERLAALVLAPGRPRNPSRKVALVLDELAELGELRRLPNLLSVGREVGVITIAAIQDLGQLVETYGETTARTLEARFGIKVIGRLTAGDTAERISKVLIGQRLVRCVEAAQTAASKNAAPEARRETHPVFPPERMETDLGVRTVRGTALIRCLILGLGDPALLDLPFTAWPDRRHAHKPAQWMRGEQRELTSSP